MQTVHVQKRWRYNRVSRTSSDSLSCAKFHLELWRVEQRGCPLVRDAEKITTGSLFDSLGYETREQWMKVSFFQGSRNADVTLVARPLDCQLSSFSSLSPPSDLVSGSSRTVFCYLCVGSDFFRSLGKCIRKLPASDEFTGKCCNNEPNVRVSSFPANDARKQKWPKWVTFKKLIPNKYWSPSLFMYFIYCQYTSRLKGRYMGEGVTRTIKLLKTWKMERDGFTAINGTCDMSDRWGKSIPIWRCSWHERDVGETGVGLTKWDAHFMRLVNARWEIRNYELLF